MLFVTHMAFVYEGASKQRGAASLPPTGPASVVAILFSFLSFFCNTFCVFVVHKGQYTDAEINEPVRPCTPGPLNGFGRVVVCLKEISMSTAQWGQSLYIMEYVTVERKSRYNREHSTSGRKSRISDDDVAIYKPQSLLCFFMTEQSLL